MASKASPRHLRVLRLSLVPLGWVAWIFTALALLSFHVSDPTYLASSPSYFSGHAHAMNWCGPVGATLAFLLMNYIGPGAWVAVIMLCCTLFVWTAGGNVTQMAFRLLGGAVLVAVGSGLTAMAGIGAQLPEGAGGLLGMGIAHFLTVKFSHVGSMLILLLGLTIGLLLAADEILLAVPAVMMAGWGRLPRKKNRQKIQSGGGRGVGNHHSHGRQIVQLAVHASGEGKEKRGQTGPHAVAGEDGPASGGINQGSGGQRHGHGRGRSHFAAHTRPVSAGFAAGGSGEGVGSEGRTG